MTSAEKRKATMIKKYGSEEAWRKALREQGRKGGKSPKTTPSGFAADPDRAKLAGRKGAMRRWAGRGEHVEEK